MPRAKDNLVDVRKARLTPPATMGVGPAAVFRALVAAADPDHFRPTDIHLLSQYCVAVDLAHQAAVELQRAGPVISGRASPWLTVQEKSVRAMTALSVRLRLGPYARLERKVAGRSTRTKEAVKPWQM